MKRTRKRRLPQSSDYDLRYCAEQRNKDGSIRRYWQPKGQKLVRLPDDLDWGKVATQLNQRRDAMLGNSITVHGTVSWVIGKYRDTDRFRSRSESTTRVYERWLGEFEKNFGMLPVSAITRKVVVDYVDIYKDKPATQGHVRAVLSLLFEQAKYHGLITENPASNLNLSSSKARESIWSAEDRAKWMFAAADHPPAVTLYFTLLEYTAQRPGDVVAMQWSQYDGERIELVQQKTGKLVRIRCHRNLRAALDEVRHDGVVRIGGPIVAEPDGKAYSQRYMRDLFRKIRAAAGNEGLQARDLRRTACVRLAEAGCTDIQIAAISGHSIERTRQILEIYVPRTEAMGAAAIDLWERNEDK